MVAYPIALPTSPNWRTSKFGPQAAVGVSESEFTFEQQVYVHQGQRWKLQATMPSMARYQAEAWLAAFTSLNGRQGTFLMGDPDGKKPRGSAPGSPVVNGSSQTGNTLITRGWIANRAGILLAGDYFQLGLGGTSRLYKMLADANSDSGGQSTLQFWPNLRTSPTDGDGLTTTNARTTWRMNSSFMWDADMVSTYGFTITATEAL